MGEFAQNRVDLLDAYLDAAIRRLGFLQHVQPPIVKRNVQLGPYLHHTKRWEHVNIEFAQINRPDGIFDRPAIREATGENRTETNSTSHSLVSWAAWCGLLLTASSSVRAQRCFCLAAVDCLLGFGNMETMALLKHSSCCRHPRAWNSSRTNSIFCLLLRQSRLFVPSRCPYASYLCMANTVISSSVSIGCVIITPLSSNR